MFTNFVFFVITWCYRTYEMYIFGELADNGLLGCTTVVGISSRKWGHFGGTWGAGPGASYELVGPVQELLIYLPTGASP